MTSANTQSKSPGSLRRPYPRTDSRLAHPRAPASARPCGQSSHQCSHQSAAVLQLCSMGRERRAVSATGRLDQAGRGWRVGQLPGVFHARTSRCMEDFSQARSLRGRGYFPVHTSPRLRVRLAYRRSITMTIRFVSRACCDMRGAARQRATTRWGAHAHAASGEGVDLRDQVWRIWRRVASHGLRPAWPCAHRIRVFARLLSSGYWNPSQGDTWHKFNVVSTKHETTATPCRVGRDIRRSHALQRLRRQAAATLARAVTSGRQAPDGQPSARSVPRSGELRTPLSAATRKPREPLSA